MQSGAEAAGSLALQVFGHKQIKDIELLKVQT